MDICSTTTEEFSIIKFSGSLIPFLNHVNCGGGSAFVSTQDKVRFEFSLITIMLSVEQLQSEERIIEGRTAVEKKRGKIVTIIFLIMA